MSSIAPRPTEFRTGLSPRALHGWHRVLGVLAATLLALAIVGAPSGADPLGQATAFTDPAVVGPAGIANGPDGALWFADLDASLIGRIATDGTITTFTNPLIDGPQGITTGPDGNLWFTNTGSGSIGRMTPAGTVSTFADASGDTPDWITTGPDGNMWFTSSDGSSVSRITPAGAITRFTNGIANPYGIAAGPDGNLWVTANVSGTPDQVLRVSPSGDVTEFPVPGLDDPRAITAGVDGALWFTSAGSDAIGRITTDGAVALFTDPTVDEPFGITATADGSIWFTNTGTDTIGRRRPDGTMSAIGHAALNLPASVAVGPDANLWATSYGGAAVLRIGTEPQPPSAPRDVTATPSAGALVVSWEPPFDDGGDAVTDYTATVSPGGATCGWSSGPTACTISGLPNGIEHVVAVTATGAGGTSAPSLPSAPARPTACGAPGAAGPFPDVPVEHTFCAAIEWLAADGYATGYADGAFRPTNAVSRQALVALLHRLAGSPAPAPDGPAFADVPPSHQFASAIEWAADEGLVQGYPSGGGLPTLHPTAAVTRQAAAAIWHRLEGAPPLDAPSLPPFADVGADHPFAAEIRWVDVVGLLQGYDDNTFHPGSPLSRQALAALLLRTDQRGDGPTTALASRAAGGPLGNGNAREPSISGDGRFVAFTSTATNLVPEDSYANADVYLLDRANGSVQLVSRTLGGTPAGGEQPVVSADGRHVAFVSSSTGITSDGGSGLGTIVVWDRLTGAATRSTVARDGGFADANAWNPTISGDGRFIAFFSRATNLVLGGGGSYDDVFVWDRVTGTTMLVSSGVLGAGDDGMWPSISGDGRFVAYETIGVDVVAPGAGLGHAILVWDRSTGSTTVESRASDGSLGDGNSQDPAISSDGRFVAFTSIATNLAASDTGATVDVFVRDRLLGMTHRISVAPDGVEADDHSTGRPAISGDGGFVAWTSQASNLVAAPISGDTYPYPDVFRWDRRTGHTTQMSLTPDGMVATSSSDSPAISADGSHVAFRSFAEDLVLDDGNGRADIFVSSAAP